MQSPKGFKMFLLTPAGCQCCCLVNVKLGSKGLLKLQIHGRVDMKKETLSAEMLAGEYIIYFL